MQKGSIIEVWPVSKCAFESLPQGWSKAIA